MHTRTLATSLVLTLILAGCLSAVDNDGSPDEYVLAFSVKDDYQSFVAEADPLAAWIEAETGTPTRILAVSDESASLLALSNGQAHAGFLDGGAGWIGWKSFDLDAIAADQKGDGRTSYTAYAWVKADSGIETLEDLRDTRSCHTGQLKSSGMLAPMGHLIGNGYIDMDGLDEDDISSLQAARERFFASSTIGGGYVGALQCLSADNGDVAFAKDSTWDDYCGVEDAPDWCLDRDAYRVLPEDGFAQVPSHPVMVAPNLPDADRAALRDALLALNDNEDGEVILRDILNTPGITEVDTESHLGSWGEALEPIPGIRAYLEGKAIAE